MNSLKSTYKNYITICLVLLFNTILSAQNLDKIGKKDMVKVNGGINASAVLLQSNDTLQKRQPFTWFASGNLTLSVLDFSIPLSYSYSNQKGNFTQPFNRLSLSPTYKWVKTYIGYNSINFSNYTLAGHAFLGGGIELSPKNWKVTAMGGQLLPAIKYNGINENEVAYKRMGYGAKVGYGKDEKEINLIVFKAYDDKLSLPVLPINTTVLPQDNLVLSGSSKLKFAKYFMWEGEYSMSILTRNISSENLDSKTKNVFSNIYKFKSTTETFDAYKTSIGFGSKFISIKANYERVAPNYATLGAYFINNDFENYTLAPMFNLFKNKLKINSNVGLQKNNLENSKVSSYKRIVASANVNFVPSAKWNISSGYSNFNNYTRIRPLPDPFSVANPIDTLNFYQVTQNANASILHTFGGKTFKQFVSVNGNYQVSAEAGETKNSPPSQILSSSIAYNLNHTGIKTNFSLSGNFNQNTIDTIVTNYVGPTANVSKSFLKNTLKTQLGFSYNEIYMQNEKTGFVYSYRSGINYSPKPKKNNIGKITFGINTAFLQRQRNIKAGNKAQLEFQGTANLAYSF